MSFSTRLNLTVKRRFTYIGGTNEIKLEVRYVTKMHPPTTWRPLGSASKLLLLRRFREWLACKDGYVSPKPIIFWPLNKASFSFNYWIHFPLSGGKTLCIRCIYYSEGVRDQIIKPTSLFYRLTNLCFQYFLIQGDINWWHPTWKASKK